MLIDSHCHLPHGKFQKKPLQDIIGEARSEGVARFVSVGTSLKVNEIVINTAEEFNEVSCTIGVYPHDDLEVSFDRIKKRLEDQLKSSDKIVGIGECGIDISDWEGGRSIEDQVELFKLQVRLAKDYSLPLVIHNRNGDDIILDSLNQEGTEFLVGVAHCFSSDWSMAKQLLDMGFYISFSGIITYPSGKDILETVRNVPMSKFVLETDAPYLPPQGHRGETNYPKYVKIVAEKVAQVKEKPLNEIMEAAYENTLRLFQIV